MDFRLCVLWGSTRQAFQTVPAEDLRAPFRARPSGMREASPEVHSTPTEVLRAARVGLGRCSKERAKTEGKRGGLKGWSKHQDKNSGTKIHLYLRSKTCMFFFVRRFCPPRWSTLSDDLGHDLCRLFCIMIFKPPVFTKLCNAMLDAQAVVASMCFKECFQGSCLKDRRAEGK